MRSKRRRQKIFETTKNRNAKLGSQMIQGFLAIEVEEMLVAGEDRGSKVWRRRTRNNISEDLQRNDQQRMKAKLKKHEEDQKDS